MPRPNLNLDLGLAVVSTMTKHGVCWTAEDLADVCNCHPQTILNIEAKALAKLRSALKKAEVGQDYLGE